MLTSITGRLGAFRQRLTHLDNQPVSKAALVVLAFLDFFILTSIINGLDNHTRQLPRPADLVPQICQEAILDSSWNATNRLDNLVRTAVNYANTSYNRALLSDAFEPLARCVAISAAYKGVRDDAKLIESFRQYLSVQRELKTLNADVNNSKGAYDTQLLEKMGGEPSGVKTPAIRSRVNDSTGKLNELTGKLAGMEASFAANPKVLAVFSAIDSITPSDREALRGEWQSLNFWHPAKRLGMEMIFLLPLIVAFYFWNIRSIARERKFQLLVSSHLLVVTCIPVLFKVMEFLWDILPHKLVRELIELLAHYRLVALWDYLVIAISIAAALGLVYLFQKKLFSSERMMLRRIAKGQCQGCGSGLPAGSAHCPACGFSQYISCPHCSQPAFVHGRHCSACGKPL